MLLWILFIGEKLTESKTLNKLMISIDSTIDEVSNKLVEKLVFHIGSKLQNHTSVTIPF